MDRFWLLLKGTDRGAVNLSTEIFSSPSLTKGKNVENHFKKQLKHKDERRLLFTHSYIAQVLNISKYT